MNNSVGRRLCEKKPEMMMSAGLGIRIGTVTSVAALDTSHDPYAPRDFATDEAMPTVVKRSALDLHPGSEPSLAETSERNGRQTLSGFADRVGDPVPLIDEDGQSHLAEDLFAAATRALVAEASAGADSNPTVVITHPDRWSSYTADVLREALDRAGVEDATLVPESSAAMRWLEGSRGPASDGLTVIYDLGGNSLAITLMRTGSEAGTIGNGVHSQDFGGAQFDHLITQYVLETVSSSTSFEFDPFDPDTVGALVELRARCSEAKEQLSYDTATTLTVDLPGLHSDTRLVRDEVEDLLRQPILGSIELIRDSLHTAGLDAADVTQVLLTGGSSSIPLVAELISSELRAPVVTGPHPDRIPAIGGALIANEVAQSVVADVPPVAAPAPLTRSAPRPAPSSAASAAAATGMSGRKKAGIVLASVAALAILAGGGLSLGTALTGGDAPVETAVSENTAGTTSTTAPKTTAEAAAAVNQTTENGLPAPTVAADGTLIPAAGTVIAPDGTVVADPNVAGSPAGAPAPAAPVPAAPNASDPGVPAPAYTPPADAAPAYTPPAYNPPAYNPPAYTPPAYNPPPAYTPPAYNGPTLGDVGQGVGDLLPNLTGQ
ncbi:Hsp70 family protein [Rhodococcus sp. G-MC3]|uniref:Hsp70 family protein n=1 Tax=Rhodococcus sp. G-MC3 TaxID=3046209 RepID=UPI0024BA496F|nr:Hsp70 family protein [Rhodococcus sp. G-MC3]MDJ0395292.1 Hsp70 family protein [Rhodococcus sp. G-MC3]